MDQKLLLWDSIQNGAGAVLGNARYVMYILLMQLFHKNKLSGPTTTYLHHHTVITYISMLLSPPLF